MHGTVLAYGQTGSGKTHTVVGPTGSGQDGLLGMTLQYLFSPTALSANANAAATASSPAAHTAANAAADAARRGSSTADVAADTAAAAAASLQPLRSFTLDLSMMELYNEELRDLLAAGHGPRPPTLKLLVSAARQIRCTWPLGNH